MKKTFIFLVVAELLFVLFPSASHSQEASQDSVYNFVQKMPEYPGGQEGILTYFVENMRYPLAAYLKAVSGTAYVNFIVEKDGSVSDVHILKPVGFGCDEEAIRLVSNMKGWVPGELDGKKVRVRSNVPVFFKEELYPGSRICTNPDTLPKFPGGSGALSEYLQKETKIPPEAKENDISGIVAVNFVVEKDGTVSNVMILDSLGYGCNEEALRVISNMPAGKPGYLNGEPVRTLVILNVKFGGDVYTIVEKMPQFPGGMGELMKYLASNIKYPPQAKNNGIQGRIFVNFIVEPDGIVSDVKILKGIGGGCDKEALRVVKNMPRWEPGVQKGKPVRVSYNLPIKFTLKGK